MKKRKSVETLLRPYLSTVSVFFTLYGTTPPIRISFVAWWPLSPFVFLIFGELRFYRIVHHIAWSDSHCAFFECLFLFIALLLSLVTPEQFFEA